jgi:hypothetical protein
MVLISLALIGCGNDNSSAPPPPIVTQIFSDSVIDGDILVPFGSPISSGTITEGMTLNIQSVFAGIDPATGNEYRAFLDFPLGGQNGVPLNASIVSATIDIVIDSVSVSPGTAIPIRVDLVSFPPPLMTDDFNSAPLLTNPFVMSITSADVNPNHVFIDVTALMVEAQNQALPNFQIRLLNNSGTPGLIQIDDSTGANRVALAPLLQVEYF